MIARCPHCGSCWSVPAGRVGAGGARIRCPGCEGTFHWRLEGDTVPAEHTPAAGGLAWDADGAVRASTPEVAARLAVEEIPSEAATAIVTADAAGVLFATEGSRVTAAFDRYRQLAGPAAPASLFRAALRERLGVELPGWEERT